MTLRGSIFCYEVRCWIACRLLNLPRQVSSHNINNDTFSLSNSCIETSLAVVIPRLVFITLFLAFDHNFMGTVLVGCGVAA